MKQCKVCKEYKVESDFYEGRSDCKACQRIYILGWQSSNKGRIKIAKRKYRHSDKGRGP